MEIQIMEYHGNVIGNVIGNIHYLWNMGVSENVVYPIQNPMVLLIIIPFLNG